MAIRIKIMSMRIGILNISTCLNNYKKTNGGYRLDIHHLHGIYFNPCSVVISGLATCLSGSGNKA